MDSMIGLRYASFQSFAVNAGIVTLESAPISKRAFVLGVKSSLVRLDKSMCAPFATTIVAPSPTVSFVPTGAMMFFSTVSVAPGASV